MADSAISPPLELCALIDFLEHDDRPAAILRACKIDHQEPLEPRTLYANHTFNVLGFVDEDVQKILVGLDASIDVGADKGHTRIVEVRERTWRLTVVAQKYYVLTCASSLPNAKEEHSRDPGETTRPQPALEHNGANGITELADSPFQEWRKFPAANLSAWVEEVSTFDWASTGLGPMSIWPELLRGYVGHIMSNPNARLLVWGSDRTLIYNEASIPLWGNKHPEALGKPVSEPCAEMWNEFEPVIEASFGGKVVKMDNVPFLLQRKGFLEETYWNLVALPITGDEGLVDGLYLELADTTQIVTGQRRRGSVMKVSQEIRAAESLHDLWPCFLQALDNAVEDIPFALLYTLVDEPSDEASESSESGRSAVAKRCVLQGTIGIGNDHPDVPESFLVVDQFESRSSIVGPCLQVYNSQSSILISHDGTLPERLCTPIPGRGFGDSIRTALVAPVTLLGTDEVIGVLVLGLNPRSSLDGDYKIYMDFLSDILNKHATLISLPEEQRRAQKIADEMNTALAQQLRLITLQAERKEAKFARMASVSPFYVNDAYLRLLGESKEQHTSCDRATMAWHEHIHPDDLPRFVDAWHRVVKQKAPLTMEHRLKKPWTSVDKASGQEISGETWLLVNAFPDVDADGQISSIQGWLHDISYRKFTDGLVSRKLEEALENKRQTENFIDMTSHEMRNPLGAMLQSADSIVSTLEPSNGASFSESLTISRNVADEVVDAAKTIILCAQHQKRIVDDILTLSKLDASLLDLAPDKVKPPVLLQKAVKMYEAGINRAGIALTTVIESTYEELAVDHIVLDPSRLLQVIINLLTNAIKFTQQSERKQITISLGAYYGKPTGNHHGVDFIPTKDSKKPESPLEEWGDGEILYLQIAVEDTGRGLSEEDVKILFQRFSQASPKTYKQYGGSGLGLFISRQLCELQGGQIGVSSRDGKTTFVFFVRAKQWIPDAPQERAHRPALPRFTSTSASPATYNRRGSVAPIDVGAGVQEKLTRVGSINETDEAATASSMDGGKRLSPQDGKAVEGEVLHVLVVEDNLINQKVMAQQLRRAGCVVHVANHGLECLGFLEKSAFCSAELPLSVVLLDLEMPTMDGLTCIKTIRERQVSGAIVKHVPVICITANARNEQISIAIEAGMDTLVTKPFRIPELIPQIHALIHEISEQREAG
ncbi:hypothetical protein LTR37_006600 [Vermiconidia calcicola]|uniref:Uncharacterized protein n=1 Tax=Vermiconidia calcicola TaxID=1690605 RepID=A0ACC3NG90_9PEZI|nr:hypothetical protein LTR37_006600 [Vermiconidia calcicola]